MAFRFNSIDQQMSTPTSQANIFDPSSQEAQGGGAQDMPRAPSSSSSSMNGGAGGGGGMAGGGESSAQGSSGAAPSSSQVSAFKANAQRIKAPDAAIEGVKGTLASADQKLQADANAYTQKASDTAKSYELDKSQVDKAAAGDEEAMKGVGSRLSGQKPTDFESFGGFGSDAPTAADRLKDPVALFRDNSEGRNYTSGLGRYDSALLRNSRDFRGIQAQLQAEQERLKQESDQKTKELTEKARANILSGYEKGNADIKAYLSGLGDDTLRRSKEAEAAEDARRAALSEADIGNEQYGQIMQELSQDYAKGDPESLGARGIRNDVMTNMVSNGGFSGRSPSIYGGGKSPVDLGQYVNIDRDTDYREFVTPEEVQRWNRIQGLLGGKDVLTAVEGGPGDPYSFNKQSAYSAIMDDIVGRQLKRDEAEAAKKAAEEAQMKAIGAKATAPALAAQKALVQKLGRLGRGGSYMPVTDKVGIGRDKAYDPYNILT